MSGRSRKNIRHPFQKSKFFNRGIISWYDTQDKQFFAEPAKENSDGKTLDQCVSRDSRQAWNDALNQGNDSSAERNSSNLDEQRSLIDHCLTSSKLISCCLQILTACCRASLSPQ